MIVALPLVIHVAILLSIPMDWPLHRIIIALIANTLAFMAIALYLVTRS